MKIRNSISLSDKGDLTKILLSLVFIVLVFVPLLTLFSKISAENIKKVVETPAFAAGISNSVKASVLATIITLIPAYFAAVAIERVNIKLKSIFRIIFILPMLIPSISNGMGLIILFGNNGILTKLLKLNFGIYGLHGIVFGSFLYAFPVAFIMLADILRYEDSSPYEAAKVLGIDKLHSFTAITWPYLRKPLISIIFSTFTLIVTDYGVPLMVGGKYTTIPVIMYQEVIGQLNFGKGAVYASFLLIPAVIAFVIDLSNKDRGKSGYITKPFEPEDNKLKQSASYILCIAISIIVILPIISFIILGFTAKYPSDLTATFANIIKTLNLHGGDYLFNSVVIALFVSLIGIVIAFLTAYLTSRMESKASRFLHLASVTSAAIPGLVLGLSYVLVFKGSAIYGTIAILIMVNIIHFIASPYFLAYNSLSKMNENLEAVGYTLGISRALLIKDVIIPSCKGTILEMFSYFFVNSMMTISAVSFLATTANKPISLMINQFEAQMQLECAAIVSLAILVINLLIKSIVHLIKTKS